ncbi:GRAM domain-containing protein 2B-like [Sabethes cyaneus]|uniref:GRAM domain-containing protein 2B-like n=1 Tax=Sabethes cyaneus TaxID=53552 RepID=UPI00237D331B|nr:GRAM domain-containing protein 2B-like [Sabethes cyaneus]XP_053693831.1 GRAM domain-containing protein 2B-like [Sabethes cyaneus]XP_053693832.1 GRAM domain-containing protein 2B-like [Sabethes cyaneus]XP_053693833.1 GRAM domain-containing protein 2B-like [Sabethes cyaneus]XP_053693834.1 GRAM domain-containing protein 2B-like [Sabethes cyaneus]XP_053693835.1 GRAM domain-containing protein 2B-like [Sabethes cyaneus]XP_053693836.1 GRAM domain-containing protein 2B-like [Sabethes cyaneus]
MVSLSEDSNGTQRKSKFLPQLVRRLGIGKNKTMIKIRNDLEDEVCLRKKMVSFDCNDIDFINGDGVGSSNYDRPSTLPLTIKHNETVQEQRRDGREEKAISLGCEQTVRLTSILKSGYQVNGIDNERESLVKSKPNGRLSEDCTNSSGNESSTSPFRRGSSFRQSFSYLFKRNRSKMKDRSCTSDSDSNAVLELDEENDDTAHAMPLLDAFLPEKVPTKRASTGDIFDDIVIQLNEDFDVKTSKRVLHRRTNSDSYCISLAFVNNNRSTSSVGAGFRPLPISSTIELLSSSDVQSQNSNQLSRSPSHNTSVKSDQKSLKSLTSSPLSVPPNIRSSSPYPLKVVAKNEGYEKPEKPEKEKKKKEFNSSRQKKFSRHFIQVEDEKVLNYFSCALVSDILLQGHLYITQNYFAFYSNVFGYVTKLLIPTVSVIKISKEKTAKMFPNAVGVQTCDDRHVFGSFMSREAAYRLMCSVWRPVAPPEVEEPIAQKAPDVEVSECSAEDDSSCSISGNESSSHVKDKKSDVVDSGDSINDKLTVIDGSKRSLDASKSIKSVQKEIIIKSPVALIASAAILKTPGNTLKEIPRSSDIPHQTSNNSVNINNGNHSMLTRLRTRLQQIFPSDFGVIHVGIILAIVLALFSCFLMYKIHYLQSRIYNFNNFRWGEDDNMDVYAEVLKWQKQMQEKSTVEAQIVLNSNLEQIAKVRKSLETLSILLHDSTKRFGIALSDSHPGDTSPSAGSTLLETPSTVAT